MTFPHTVIRASAGTGKTYQLSTRYLALLRAGVEPERILATTFTRKAAGEILERVLQRLARPAVEPSEVKQLAAALGDERLTREDCLELLSKLARNLHRLRIGTLDSFFAQIATSFSLELGMPPGWRIVDPHVDQRLRREAMEMLLADEDPQELSRLLHLMTKGEAKRSISELLHATVDDLYAVFLATEPSAWENFPRVSMLTAETLNEVLEQLEAAELPDSRAAKARDADVANARCADWETFISKGLAAKVRDGTRMYYKKPIPEPVVALYEKLLKHARAFFIEQLKYQTVATYELLARFDEAYQQRKRAARAMTFDDVTRSLAMSREIRSLDRIPLRMDGDIGHLLLDEFQDTSYWQWRVLRPLAERVTQSADGASGEPGSFFCVGDGKQAIYGWRGGRSEIFAAIEAQLEGLERQTLSQSRRSAPAVIETVNHVFTHIAQHPELEAEAPAVQEWVSAFVPHTTVHAGEPGYVRMEVAENSDEDQDVATCRHVAARVAQLVEQCPGREIGVLTRTNATAARIIFELKQLGIAASEEGGNPLTDSAAVCAVLALLRLADHPGDTVSRFHVASSPLGRALGYQAWHDDLTAERLAESLREQLLQSGYGSAVRTWVRMIDSCCSARDRSRLEQLVDLAYGYESEATLRPCDFVRFVDAQRVADPSAARVRVMTVHQSKGLEFDIVVATEFDGSLVGQPKSYVVRQVDVAEPIDAVCMYRNATIQQLLPDWMQAMFDAARREAVIETLCVLYVALTRAAHALYLVLSPAKENERKLPRTVAGCLRASLAPDVPALPGAVLYEYGDRDWYKRASCEPRREVPRVDSQEPIRFAAPSAGAAPLRRAAPSGLEGGGRVSMSDLLELEPSTARERGTLVHAWFEQVQWLEDGRPDRETLQRLALRLVAHRANIDPCLDDFEAMLEEPAIAAVLQRSYYSKPEFISRCGGPFDGLRVYNERRFAVPSGDELVSGSIDRLVLMQRGGKVVAADIVDFKTDVVRSKPTRDLARLVEYYRPQQQAYRSAVARQYGLPLKYVSARLVFLAPRLVFPLECE